MFLKDVERFRGTGELNGQGQTLEEFLESYDPRDYEMMAHTTDIVLIRGERILLIKRKDHPCIGMWSLPGGFVGLREDLGDCARRELYEETGLRDVPLKQMLTWGSPDLDPRWRVITTPFAAEISASAPLQPGDDAADAAWFRYEARRRSGTYLLTLRRDDEILKAELYLKDDRPALISAAGIDGTHACIILQGLLAMKKTV